MMNKTYKIRLANVQDIKACVLLSTTSWPDWWKENKKLGVKFIENCIREKTCLVVTDKKEVVAFFVWNHLWNKIHISDIFITEKYRRIGIATALLKRAIEISQKRGFKEVVSDCDRSNRESIVWHLKNGFVRTGRIKGNWDGEDSITFAKNI